jgi:hypothetical protein
MFKNTNSDLVKEITHVFFEKDANGYTNVAKLGDSTFESCPKL